MNKKYYLVLFICSVGLIVFLATPKNSSFDKAGAYVSSAVNTNIENSRGVSLPKALRWKF